MPILTALGPCSIRRSAGKSTNEGNQGIAGSRRRLFLVNRWQWRAVDSLGKGSDPFFGDWLESQINFLPAKTTSDPNGERLRFRQTPIPIGKRIDVCLLDLLSSLGFD
jgi:hypothetical protein